MATNLALDDRKIAEAKRLGKHKSKKAAVTAALDEYIRLQRRRALIAAAGTIEFRPDFDPSKLRRNRTR